MIHQFSKNETISTNWASLYCESWVSVTTGSGGLGTTTRVVLSNSQPFSLTTKIYII